ncbi:hypothetical protein TNIN_227981 [Trichonephila inaurata madagascariensis]|uniref:Uncharacterized protein n=1 Tax=Trichonephila inaurata madagascariensis TaxID=2747483 RepID=A0A8X6YS48_9ARAC|nr:hypothetical protein TNIN_227981 [Trichonephila inaurata madagascariensis]
MPRTPSPLLAENRKRTGHAFVRSMCSHHFTISHGNVSAEFSAVGETHPLAPPPPSPVFPRFFMGDAMNVRFGRDDVKKLIFLLEEKEKDAL